MAKEKRSLCFSNRPAHKEGGEGGEREKRGVEERGWKGEGRGMEER